MADPVRRAGAQSCALPDARASAVPANSQSVGYMSTSSTSASVWLPRCLHVRGPDHQRHSRGDLVVGRLAPDAHVAEMPAVIAPDNDDRVVANTRLLECLDHQSDLGVDVADAGQIGVLQCSGQLAARSARSWECRHVFAVRTRRAAPLRRRPGELSTCVASGIFSGS